MTNKNYNERIFCFKYQAIVYIYTKDLFFAYYACCMHGLYPHIAIFMRDRV